MKFLLDESAEFRLAAFLEQQGHDVTAIAHDYPHALRDDDVLAIAQREQRILITNDRHFGELIHRRQLPHSGVILLRLGTAPLTTKTARLDHVLATYGDELNSFIVVTKRAVRVRRQA
ncbi:MAG: DUF5615 family PIN-like protein [Chloroflexota bacterium]